MIHLDFETRSKVNIVKTGAWRYAEDDSTSVLCLCYAIDSSSVKLWIPGNPIPRVLQVLIESGDCIFEAHNSMFEQAIYQHQMVAKHGWPEIADDRWSCTAAQAAFHSLPRHLDGVCQAINTKHKKDMGGKAVMMKLARPRKPSKNNPSIWNESPEESEKLYEYCKDDVEAERCVGDTLRKLPDKEREVWLLDQKINKRGVRVDMKSIRSSLELIKQQKAHFNSIIAELTDGAVTSSSQNAKLLEWLRNNGLNTNSVDKNAVADALEFDRPRLSEKVIKVLEIRQMLAKTSTAKYEAFVRCVCADGRVRGILLYYGAHTGRWSGRLIQPQNFPRNYFKGDLELYHTVLNKRHLDQLEFFYGDPMDIISQTLRTMLIPSEGKVFIGGDYSAIEARALVWLAGDDRALQLFRNGVDPYKDLAMSIYELGSVEGVTPEQREVGKRGILGAGYGVGWKTFKRTTWEQYRVEMTEELAKLTISTYRREYKKVVDLWKEQENAAMKAVRTGVSVKTDKTTWAISKGFLWCRLPSGRCLAYYKPEIRMMDVPWGGKKETLTYMGVNSETRKFERLKTYGGKIVENVTSAIARDVMAEAMLRLEDVGFKVVFTVHDEIVTEVERRDAGIMKRNVSHFERLMSRNLYWCPDLPLKVEGWSGDRYLK